MALLACTVVERGSFAEGDIYEMHLMPLLQRSPTGYASFDFTMTHNASVDIRNETEALMLSLLV